MAWSRTEDTAHLLWLIFAATDTAQACFPETPGSIVLQEWWPVLPGAGQESQNLAVV